MSFNTKANKKVIIRFFHRNNFFRQAELKNPF